MEPHVPLGSQVLSWSDQNPTQINTAMKKSITLLCSHWRLDSQCISFSAWLFIFVLRCRPVPDTNTSWQPSPKRCMCAHSNKKKTKKAQMSHPFWLLRFSCLFVTHLSWLNWGISLNANQLGFYFHRCLPVLLAKCCTTELKQTNMNSKIKTEQTPKKEIPSEQAFLLLLQRPPAKFLFSCLTAEHSGFRF